MIDVHEVAHTQLQCPQAVLHRHTRLRFHTAVAKQTHPRALRLHHAPAHQRIAGVNA